MAAALPMGGNRVTNAADPAAAQDLVTRNYADATYAPMSTASYTGGTSTGTANAQVLATLTPTGFTLTAGKRIVFIPGFTNTVACTMTANALAAKNIFKMGPAGAIALSGGEIVANQLAELIYDGTQFILIANAVTTTGPVTTLASAATTDLGTIPSRNVSITGVVSITSFGSTAQTAFPLYFLTFTGILTLTYNVTSLILPGAASITTAAGDTAIAIYLGGGNWQVVSYTLASGLSITTPGGVSDAGGRLTLISATPVLTGTFTSATTIYYTPYFSQFIPIYNGGTMAMFDVGGELTNLTTQSSTGSAGPAVVANNSNYDLFVWNNSGTYTLTRGPLWTSDTTRGAGAGTTELVRIKGVWLNANSITNGPAAQRGTYVGTVRSNGTATIDYQFGALSTGGTAGIIGVWNMYNRVNVSMFSQDDTNSWTYNVTTWRSANASNGMRCSFISGLPEDAISAKYYSQVSMAAVAAPGYVAIGYDATNALAAGCMTGIFTAPVAAYRGQLSTEFSKSNDIGWHFCQAIEQATAATTNTWYGDNNTPTLVQTGLVFNFRA